MPSVDLSYQVQARRRFRVAQRAPRAQQCQGSSQESLLLAVRPGAPSSFLLLLVRHLLLLAMHLLLVAMPFVTNSFLLLMVRPGAPSSFFLVAMPGAPSGIFANNGLHPKSDGLQPSTVASCY